MHEASLYQISMVTFFVNQLPDGGVARPRTYLVGGGDARGLPDDTASVYTPATGGLYPNVLPYDSFVNFKYKAVGMPLACVGVHFRV